jgi:6-phosphogluconolactonase
MIRDILLAGQPDADTVPAFDIVLLGMGDDGHTASLFPGTRALQEQERLVVANYVTSKGVWRITMTARLINAATRVMFLVVGETKADRLQDVLEGPHQPETLPAQLIRPTDGELLWLVDQAAARKLSSSAG